MCVRHFSVIAMFLFIAGSMIIGWLVPAIPSWGYIVMALVAGVAIALIERMLLRKTGEVVSDERIQKNAEWSGALVFRISYALSLLGGFILLSLSEATPNLRPAGLSLICIAVLQSLLYGVFYAIANAKH